MRSTWATKLELDILGYVCQELLNTRTGVASAKGFRHAVPQTHSRALPHDPVLESASWAAYIWSIFIVTAVKV